MQPLLLVALTLWYARTIKGPASSYATELAIIFARYARLVLCCLFPRSVGFAIRLDYVYGYAILPAILVVGVTSTPTPSCPKKGLRPQPLRRY